ncbi:hypothetical protein FISHEDRAFT_47383 [Fistulina hepatica ATCC 64428]|uniref:Uncharacterized protein n=1 Tax=Fistulina hepatica ATCC 64428 TaxID=1128425 RepID=A0A0D7A6C7_9AGAR|nr:hypothetical protein FISHEDRAFT_47383 [Fistulina hepatica ATCC 64428]
MADDESADEDESGGLDGPGGACIFSAPELDRIRECIIDVVLPTWVARPPRNLGEKSHGKLKADNWFILFSVFLPMCLPEIWSSPDWEKRMLLQNFFALVECTNIVCSFTTSVEDADYYLQEYIRYRRSNNLLFPHSRSVPNHHYAMHNGEFLKFWGPLMSVSEFAYEQRNGTFQRVKTNGHLYEIDYTMLQQICRRGRLHALLHPIRHGASQGELRNAVDGLLADDAAGKSTGVNNRRAQLLPMNVYELLLNWLRGTASGTEIRNYRALPHPPNAKVLSPYAVALTHHDFGGRTYTVHQAHGGNSSIVFHTITGLAAGFIESMWKYDLEGQTHCIMLVRTHKQLSPQDQEKSPYAAKSKLHMMLFYAAPSEEYLLIAPSDVVSHTAYRERPPGTFGIDQRTLVVHNLDRGRSGLRY